MFIEYSITNPRGLAAYFGFTDDEVQKLCKTYHMDYTDKQVTAELFMATLSGDKAKVTELTGIENPKVLAAGPEDTVFTYFIDHGDDGLIIIGDSYVSAITVMYAIETAHEKQLYGKWLWFVETCHSGSMFDRIPDNINIFAMTSSDREHNKEMSAYD